MIFNSITPGSTNVTVEWAQVTGSSNYTYEFANSSGGVRTDTFYTDVIYATGAHISIFRTGLTPSTQYFVRVSPNDDTETARPGYESAWTLFSTTT